MADAYSQGLPCLNPHCKSHGKPHPNCRCYGFAEGGEVSHFCSEKREHKEDCEYFSGGGKVPIDSAAEFTPDPVEATGEFTPDAAEEPISDSKASEFTADNDKYGTPLQQGVTMAEGFARGQLPFVAPWLEKNVLGVPEEDIKGRMAANPIESTSSEVAGFMTPSPVNLLGKLGAGAVMAGEAVGLLKGATQIGRLALKGAIETFAYIESDEATKALLGSPDADPIHPVGMALLHGLPKATLGAILGAGLGPAGVVVGEGLSAAAENKTIQHLTEKFLQKIPGFISSKTLAEPVASAVGMAAFAKATAVMPEHPQAAYQIGKTAYAIAEKRVEPLIEALNKVIGNPIGKTNKLVKAAVLNALATNTESNLPQVMDYAYRAGKATMEAAPAIQKVMSAGSAQLFSPASDDAKKKLEEFISGGGANSEMQNANQRQQQESMNPGGGFATGGEVGQPAAAVSKGIGDAYPQQNILMNAAKGRVSGYLNNLRPLPNQQKLPFDSEMKNKAKERQYQQALEIAANPITILNHINQGTLTPDHMKHLTAMYPESYGVLSKEMTKQIMEAQMKNKKPPYQKRQAMSLFLGVNLDSTMTPQALQTIQGLYANNKMQAQQQTMGQGTPKPKKSGMSAEKVASPYLTDGQARIQRGQRSKA